MHRAATKRSTSGRSILKVTDFRSLCKLRFFEVSKKSNDIEIVQLQLGAMVGSNAILIMLIVVFIICEMGSLAFVLRRMPQFVIRPSRNLQTSVGAVNTMDGIARTDFPILDRDVHPGKKLIYLDSAASSHKPAFVLDKMTSYYANSHSNVHRGAHALSVRATDLFEASRDQVQKYINAQHREEIVFTKGATDAINLVALSWGQRLQPNDEIILTEMEHHANLVPWQMLAQRTGAVLKFVRWTPSMQLDMQHYLSLLSANTKLVAFTHASNVLGSVNPASEIIAAAHKAGAVVLMDACQSVPHMPVDVQSLNPDFLVASAHKMCGPTGVGFLFGKKALLESMPPVMGGGEMIHTVELETSTYAAPPYRFEAGTPAIAGCIGLGAACEYLTTLGMQRIHDHVTRLGTYMYQQLSTIPNLELYGPNCLQPPYPLRTGLVAFNHKTIHAADLAMFLDQEGIAVRTGHHCAQPLHNKLNIPGSVRASVYFYNSQEDVDVFVAKLKEVICMFESM